MSRPPHIPRPGPVRTLATLASTVVLVVATGLATAAGPGETRGFEPQPATGHYLVASESMPDPRFRGTVILLVNHDDKGSIGVILNRPGEVPLSEVIEDAGPEPLYFGGPVEPRVFGMLFRSDAIEPSDPDADHDDEDPVVVRVIDDVSFVLGYRSVVDVHGRLATDDPHRVFAGYAGWGAGQLAGEIERGGWHLIAESPDLVFSDEPDRLWRQVMRKLRGQWI